MPTMQRPRSAEAAGRWLGAVFRRLSRQEGRLREWLHTRGMSQASAAAAIWLVRLTLAALVAYFSLLLAFALVVFAGALLLIHPTGSSRAPNTRIHEELEWRDGLLGFGAYNKDGVRVDPYDPNAPH
jgi:Protein of unknown function (DUF3742)